MTEYLFSSLKKSDITNSALVSFRYVVIAGIGLALSVGFAHLDLKLDNVIWLFNKRNFIEGNQFVIGDLGTACHSPVYLVFDELQK